MMCVDYSLLQLCMVGASGAGPPREGCDPYCSFLTPSNQLLASSILLFANFLARALASERSFYALFLAWFQVKGVSFYLFDDVFLLNFALEPAQSVIEGFTLLQSNFRQTNTPPNPSGRTE